MADNDERAADTPDDEATFREWWAEFLADWHRRYPHSAPPSEASARVAYAESRAARVQSRQERWERRPPLTDGHRRLA